MPAITTLSRAELDDAVDALTDAFAGGPLMAHVFAAAAAPPPREGVAAIMRFGCLVRLELGWPLLGARAGDRPERLAGVVGVTLPGAAVWPAALEEAHRALAAAIGPAAAERLGRFSAVAEAHRPPEAHHHVGLIGVRPRLRRRGIGTSLLEAVHELAGRDPDSVGVTANVEDPLLAAWYERRGYDVWAWDDTLGIEVWTLFRSRGGPAGQEADEDDDTDVGDDEDIDDEDGPPM